jgi:hypothetical protein
MKGLAPVIAARAVSGSIGAQEVHAALHGVAGFGKALLVGFALLWAFSIIDAARFRKDGDTSAGR